MWCKTKTDLYLSPPLITRSHKSPRWLSIAFYESKELHKQYFFYWLCKIWSSVFQALCHKIFQYTSSTFTALVSPLGECEGVWMRGHWGHKYQLQKCFFVSKLQPRKFFNEICILKYILYCGEVVSCFLKKWLHSFCRMRMFKHSTWMICVFEAWGRTT